MLAITMVVALLTIVAMAERLDVIARINDPTNPTTLDQANASDAFVALTIVAGGLVFLATVVAFVGWLHAGAQQVQRVTPGLLRYAPGWAIGAWFVPFLNLVRPVQIVNDVRRLGAPDRLRDSRALVGWWWATLLGSRLAIWVFVGSGSPDNDGVDLDALRSVAVGAIICMVIDLVAAVLAVAVVLSTTRRVQSGSDAAGWSPWQAYGYPPPAYPPPGYAQPAYPPPAYPPPPQLAAAPDGWSPPSAGPGA